MKVIDTDVATNADKATLQEKYINRASITNIHIMNYVNRYIINIVATNIDRYIYLQLHKWTRD